MKKWFLLLMLALCIPFAAQAADWSEITGAGVYGGTTVTLSGEGVYLFDGGTLENVSVGTGALQGEHFQFFGVTFTGDAVVLAARNDRQCQVWIAADCVDQTRQGVRVIAEKMVWEESSEPEAPVPTPTPVPEAPPALPRTGDSHPLMLYAVLMALSAGCIVMMMKKQ